MKVKRKTKKAIEEKKREDRKTKKVFAGERGRLSKIQHSDLKRIERMGKVGCTQQQIADILGIHFVNLWKNKNNRPEIRNALKRGQELGNKVIQRALFKRAKGFHVDAIHFSAYEGEITRSAYRKYYPPSDFSIMFWLKNRAGWKDKPDDVFDQESVRHLANKLVDIIVSKAPTEKIRKEMLSDINNAFETLQSKRSGGDSA